MGYSGVGWRSSVGAASFHDAGGRGLFLMGVAVLTAEPTAGADPIWTAMCRAYRDNRRVRRLGPTVRSAPDSAVIAR